MLVNLNDDSQITTEGRLVTGQNRSCLKYTESHGDEGNYSVYWESLMIWWDNPVRRAVWDSGIAQWVEQYGIVG